MKKLLFIALLSATSLFARVDEAIEVPYISYQIKMGKGFDSVQANCLTCHSFGYILNQGNQSRNFWHKKVLKMITHFKAPITTEDTKIITDYLYKHYGNGRLQ